MYHGANSFAKEFYRETTYAGFGCNGSIPDNRGASKSGRESRAYLYPPGLHQAGALGKESRRVSQLKKEQCQGYSALQCSQ